MNDKRSPRPPRQDGPASSSSGGSGRPDPSDRAERGYSTNDGPQQRSGYRQDARPDKQTDRPVRPDRADERQGGADKPRYGQHGDQPSSKQDGDKPRYRQDGHKPRYRQDGDGPQRDNDTRPSRRDDNDRPRPQEGRREDGGTRFSKRDQNGRSPAGRNRPSFADRGNRPPATEGRPPRRDGGDWTRGAAGALIDLDRDLMKLLVRRATLVSRIRGGRDHAASPAAIQAEKAVRIAWETGALSFSKDPRFTRQLFSLLQDIKILSREQAEGSGAFGLSPSRKPVQGSLTGPSSTTAAQVRIALAAAMGKGLILERVTLSSALADTIKACSQAGAGISYENQGALARVTVAEGQPLRFADRTIYLGEDPFTAYLIALLAVSRPGICRLTGGSHLKSADFSPLRHVLPMFGARLAHVIPRSQGLPANLECSGELPALVTVPPDLPLEGLRALLLAPLVWDRPIALDLAALPAGIATAALAEVRPVHRDTGAEVETRGPNLHFTPVPLAPPERPDLPLDPALSAYLLAMPLFCGGSLTLTGQWPAHLPEAAQAGQLLAWAGGEMTFTEDSVSLTAGTVTPGAAATGLPPQCGDLEGRLGPLYVVLKAREALAAGKSPQGEQGVAMPFLLDLFPAEEEDRDLCRDFCARLGLRYENGGLCPDPEADAGGLPAWSSPDAYWGMAFALASFLRSGIALANPAAVSESMPPFWGIFNSLPAPIDPALAEPRGGKQSTEDSDDKPARRRIIAD